MKYTRSDKKVRITIPQSLIKDLGDVIDGTITNHIIDLIERDIKQRKDALHDNNKK